VLELFSDRTSMEMYEDRALILKPVLELDDDKKIGHVAGCLVFYREAGHGHGMYDSPLEISRAYEWAIRCQFY
jgi:hypothetical protein